MAPYTPEVLAQVFDNQQRLMPESPWICQAVEKQDEFVTSGLRGQVIAPDVVPRAVSRQTQNRVSAGMAMMVGQLDHTGIGRDAKTQGEHAGR